MVLWIDSMFEPPYTENTIWTHGAQGAINAFMEKLPISIVDTDDNENTIIFFEFLHEIGALKYVDQVNIHGRNLDKKYSQLICQLCNEDNVPVTFNIPELSKLKRVSFMEVPNAEYNSLD